MSETVAIAAVDGAEDGDRLVRRVPAVDALRGVAVAICITSAIAVPFLPSLPPTPVSQFLLDQLSHSI